VRSLQLHRLPRSSDPLGAVDPERRRYRAHQPRRPVRGNPAERAEDDSAHGGGCRREATSGPDQPRRAHPRPPALGLAAAPPRCALTASRALARSIPRLASHAVAPAAKAIASSSPPSVRWPAAPPVMIAELP